MQISMLSAAKSRLLLLVSLTLLSGILTLALPMLAQSSPVAAQAESVDQPEEVLRTEIILEARSPADGSLITAAEYAEMQAQIEAQNQAIGTVPPEIRRLIGLLRLRKALRSILPFLP